MWVSGVAFESRFTYVDDVIVILGQQTSCQPDLPETSGASGWKVGC